MTIPHDTHRNRAQGCLLGLLIGDNLGSTVEFRSAADIARQYPDGVCELADGGTWNTLAGQPTDDGEMALALARTLVEQESFDDEQVAAAYVGWLASDPFDRGGTISRALSAGLSAMRSGDSAAAACRAAASTQSQANGALMRIAPLGIFASAAPREGLVSWARADAQLTHPHPVCQDANAAYVIALATAIADGATPAEVYGETCDWAASAGAADPVQQVLAAAETRLPEGCDGPKSGWVLIALQNAFYRLLHAKGPEDAIVDTIMLGGDTDTTAAICGALLGAAHGIDAIPSRWTGPVLSCRPEAGAPQVKRPRPPEYWPLDALELAERLLVAGDTAAPTVGT